MPNQAVFIILIAFQETSQRRHCSTGWLQCWLCLTTKTTTTVKCTISPPFSSYLHRPHDRCFKSNRCSLHHASTSTTTGIPTTTSLGVPFHILLHLIYIVGLHFQDDLRTVAVPGLDVCRAWAWVGVSHLALKHWSTMVGLISYGPLPGTAPEEPFWDLWVPVHAL